MAKHNYSLIIYAILGMILLEFGFYSSTMQYVDAISISTITTTHRDLRGISYSTKSNAWYTVSPTNNTLVKIIDNTTTVTSAPINSLSNCEDARDVKVLGYNDESYIAILCRQTIPSTHGIMIRDRVTNHQKDFETGITNTDQIFDIEEWDAGDKFYSLNHGSTGQQIAIYNLLAVNSTTSNLFVGTVSVATTCPNIYDGVIIQSRNEFWITCTNITGSRDSIIVFDLQGSVITKVLFLVGSTSTQNIDYNSNTDTIVVTSYENNDLFTISATAKTPLINNTAFCDTGKPLQPQFNQNTNQLYVMCNNDVNGQNTIKLFDIASSSVVTSFSGLTTNTGVQGGTNNWMSMEWQDSKSALYITYGWTSSTQTTNPNLTRISDTTLSSGGETVCIDTNLDGERDLCFTDTNGDGVADNGQLGALGVYRSNANLTQFGSDVFCAFGISSAACTNKDIKTNGVGLTYLMILVIWSYAFLVGTHIFAVKKIQKENIQVMDAIRINPILLLAMLVIDAGIAFYLSWIPNTIFYTVIVILIGLAGFGIYRQVRGGE